MKSISILFSVFVLFLSTQAHADPLGSQNNPASSCRALYDSGQTTSGIYWILINGSVSSGAFSDAIAYCDMNTDNHAGWMLVAYADNGNFTSGLATTTSSSEGLSDRRGSMVLGLPVFIRSASKMAFSWTSPGDPTPYPNGDLTSYSHAFSIPAPNTMNFSDTPNPPYSGQNVYYPGDNVNGAFSICYGGNTPTVNLSDLVGNPISGGLLPSTMYYRPQTFAMNCNSSSCDYYGFIALGSWWFSGFNDTLSCTTLDFAPANMAGNAGGYGFYIGAGGQNNGQLFTSTSPGSNQGPTSTALNTVAIWLLL